jgi:hypothetical protein
MKLTWIVFAVMVVAQWLAPMSLIRKHEQVLTQGEIVKFKCGAPDPFDPLRGRYLTVRVEDAHATMPKPSPFKGGETVYATITVGADGFALFDTIYAEPPTSGLYLKCKLPGYLYDAPRVLMEVPIERYYVNEEVAPKADEWLSKVRSERGGITWVEVKILKGSAVITDIKHDGKSVNDVIRDAR